MNEFKCEKCNKDFGTKEASDMHNKAKHPEEHKEPFISSVSSISNKQKKMIKIFGALLIIVLLISIIFYWRSAPQKDAPAIDIIPNSYNFGTVSQAKGVVSTTMTIRNKGMTDLVLNKIDSSCGCTSAAVVYRGIEGPRFSMAGHGGANPKNWKQEIPPGDTAELKIYYDPNVHREMRGAFTRFITIYSNDPRKNALEIRISGVQAN